MRCLVTGSCGFIGSHLCEALHAAGHEVTALRWTHAESSWPLDGVRIVTGDIRSHEDMSRFTVGQDAIFHLAAKIDVAESYDKPYVYLDTNILGTHNVLQVARARQCKVIYASSSEIYGSAQYTPMDETHPLHAQSPYAATKVAAEQLVEAYRLSYGLEAVVLRPFNTYGPRQSTPAVIGRIMTQAHGPEEKISLGDLSPKRDFTYVSDTVAAFMAVMDLDEGVFNCGTGHAVTIGEVAERASNGKIVTTDKRRFRPSKSEVRELCCDPYKINIAAGWSAKVGLEEGLRLTAEWYRARYSRLMA